MKQLFKLLLLTTLFGFTNQWAMTDNPLVRAFRDKSRPAQCTSPNTEVECKPPSTEDVECFPNFPTDFLEALNVHLDQDERDYGLLGWCLHNPSFQSPSKRRNILHLLVRIDQRRYFVEIAVLLSYYHEELPAYLDQAFLQTDSEGFPPIHLAAFLANSYCFALFCYLNQLNFDIKRIYNNKEQTVFDTACKSVGSFKRSQDKNTNRRYVAIKKLITSYNPEWQSINDNERDDVTQIVCWQSPDGQLQFFCGRCYKEIDFTNKICPHCEVACISPRTG